MQSKEGSIGVGNPWTSKEKSRILEIPGRMQGSSSQLTGEALVQSYTDLLRQAGLPAEKALYRREGEAYHFVLMLPGMPLEDFRNAIEINMTLQKQFPKSSFMPEVRVTDVDTKKLLQDGFQPVLIGGNGG